MSETFTYTDLKGKHTHPYDGMNYFLASGSYSDLFLVDGTKENISQNVTEIGLQLDKEVFYPVSRFHLLNLTKVKGFRTVRIKKPNTRFSRFNKEKEKPKEVTWALLADCSIMVSRRKVRVAKAAWRKITRHS